MSSKARPVDYRTVEKHNYYAFMNHKHEEARTHRCIPITEFFDLNTGSKRKSLLDRFTPRDPDDIKEDFTERINNYHNHYLAITIAPRPDIGVDYEEYITVLRRLLANTAHKYLLIPALDNNMKMHHHGIVWFQRMDMQKRFVKLCNQFIGFTEIKVINDTVGWTKYVYEDHQQTEILNTYDDIKTWTKYEVCDFHKMYIQVDEDSE